VTAKIQKNNEKLAKEGKNQQKKLFFIA